MIHSSFALQRARSAKFWCCLRVPISYSREAGPKKKASASVDRNAAYTTTRDAEKVRGVMKEREEGDEREREGEKREGVYREMRERVEGGR